MHEQPIDQPTSSCQQKSPKLPFARRPVKLLSSPGHPGGPQGQPPRLIIVLGSLVHGETRLRGVSGAVDGEHGTPVAAAARPTCTPTKATSCLRPSSDRLNALSEAVRSSKPVAGTELCIAVRVLRIQPSAMPSARGASCLAARRLPKPNLCDGLPAGRMVCLGSMRADQIHQKYSEERRHGMYTRRRQSAAAPPMRCPHVT